VARVFKECALGLMTGAGAGLFTATCARTVFGLFLETVLGRRPPAAPRVGVLFLPFLVFCAVCGGAVGTVAGLAKGLYAAVRGT